MNHEQIIEWAGEHGLSVQHTQQGLDMTSMFDVTLITGAHPAPASAAREHFDAPDRTHEPTPGQRVLGYDDDHAIVVLIDADEDGTTDPWLHIMLYDDAETYERGWETQAPASNTVDQEG